MYDATSDTDEDFLDGEGGLSQDRRAELGVGALVCAVVFVLLAMLAFILKEAWRSFAHNGLRWFGPGGNVDSQLTAIYNSGENLTKPEYTLHAWPLIWSTILTTVGAVGISL